MTNNASLGPVQVFRLDIASLNYALRDLSERIDQLKGLRGRAAVYDRLRVSSPTEASDAVDLGSINDRESLFTVSVLALGGAQLVLQPASTTYVEVSTALRQRINFASPASLEMRLLARAWGTETGSGKGLAVSDGSNVLAQVTWDGSAEGLQIGSFTAIAAAADATVQIHAKGSSSTESLIVTQLSLDFRYTISVV
jgi:hypothetical protein